VKKAYPRAETAPITNPSSIDPQGDVIMSAFDPIATPPANVAFNKISISSFPFAILATQQAEIQLHAKERYVLITTLY
jgi:hypothetical protein